MLRAGQAIVLAVVALLTLGLVMVTSAGLTIDAQRAVTFEAVVTGRTMTYAVAAVALLTLGAFLNVEWFSRPWGRLGPASDGRVGMQPGMRGYGSARLSALARHPATWLFLVSTLTLLMVYLPGVGREVNGAKRWVNLGPEALRLSFQPSELAKWATVIVVAAYAAARPRAAMARFWTGLLPGLALVMLVTALIVLEDLGTAVLIGAVSLLILFAAGARWWHIAVLFPAPAALVGLAVVTSEYRQRRLATFVNPYADPQGDGYHMIQSMIAVAEGKITGRGLGHGVHKFGYLPEDTTDFLFAVVCEELGVFGAAFVVFLYATLIFAGLRILTRQRNPMAQLVGLGVVATVGFQALINLTVVTGLAPTKGIALPLLSSGGTGWMLTAFCLGLLVGMDRREAAEAAAPLKPAVREDRPLQTGAAIEVISIAAPASMAL